MEQASNKHIFAFDWHGPDAQDAFAAIADLPYSLFFDSAKKNHALSRYSYLCWSPFETIESKDGMLLVTNADHQFSFCGDAFEKTKERLNLWGTNFLHDQKLPPFQGGAAGYFGYDLARQIEKIPESAKPHEQPDMCIGLYDKVLAFDHDNDRAYFMVHAENEKVAKAQLRWFKNRLNDHVDIQGNDFIPQWSAKKSDDDYKADIERVIEYIYAGDIFQANLSRRYSCNIATSFHPYTHYRDLRRMNAAPFGAYMNFGSVRISSCSPERFIRVKGQIVETRPIKGTMPSSVPAADLAMSEKDRAENIMIVDLLRNDLSKVCEDNSVIITGLCEVESFEGLHHMTSTIQGTLQHGKGAMDALRAGFPGGSITGAPKIRAMEIIEELEPDRRGIYCGAIGWVGFDGTMETAITIRTLVYEDGRAHIQAGGGITALSNPEQELNETKLKADKLFGSFFSLEQARKRA